METMSGPRTEFGSKIEGFGCPPAWSRKDRALESNMRVSIGRRNPGDFGSMLAQWQRSAENSVTRQIRNFDGRVFRCCSGPIASRCTQTTALSVAADWTLAEGVSSKPATVLA